MSFISFLKQAGLDILKGAQIFMGIAPIASSLLQPSNPTVSGKIDSLDQMVGQAINIEQSFAAAFGSAKTGTAKLQALIPQVQQIVLSSEALAGKKVGDDTLFAKAMQEYAQATVDLSNSLHANTNASTSASAPPPAVSPQPVPTPPPVVLPPPAAAPPTAT